MEEENGGPLSLSFSLCSRSHVAEQLISTTYEAQTNLIDPPGFYIFFRVDLFVFATQGFTSVFHLTSPLARRHFSFLVSL